MHWILKLILHLFFWCNYCLFAGIIGFKLDQGFDFILEYIWVFAGNGIWAIIIFYLHYLYFIKSIYQKKYTLYLVFSLLSSLVLSILFFLFYSLLFRTEPIFSSVEFFGTFLGTFIIGNCGSLLKGFISWTEEAGRKNELEKQTLKVELELLRSQLNHHFLFNTLNNIDALIFKNPQKASDALISLSSILRYMLYDANTDKVPLENELKNIENIIYLEQLRVTTPNYTKVTVEGNNSATMIPPLLFVSFVENAYKHSKYKGKLPVIEINIYSENNYLIFTCTNSMEPAQKQPGQPGNLGLENIKRRLNLLYGNTCKLDITAEDSLFKVYLKIPC